MIRSFGVSFRAGLLAALLAFGLGCGARAQVVGALKLSALESRVISPDGPLEVSGEGLPTGATVDVELRGTLYAAGSDPRSLRVSLAGRVLSPEHLNAVVRPELLAAWGYASFEGDIELSCKAGRGGLWRGRLSRVSFDVDPADVRSAQRLRHEVKRVLSNVGLVISDQTSMSRGLEVAAVGAGSRAERAGLLVGDVIVRSNGVRLHALAELAPGPSADRLELWVRHGGGHEALVRLPLASAAPLSDLRTLGWSLLACVGLALLGRRLRWPAPGVLLLELSGRVRERLASAPSVFWLGVVMTALLGGWCAVYEPFRDPFALLVVHLGVLVALRGARLGRGWPFALDVFGLWFGVACVAALSGTRAWAAIVHDQSAAPWTWNALARPPLAIALLFSVHYAARLHAEASASVAPGRFSVAFAESGLRALVAVLCGALFLGGAGVSTGSVVWIVALGAVCAAAKSVLCYVLMESMAAGRLRPGARLWAVLVAAACVWSWVAPSRVVELQVGSALALFGALWLCVALVQARRHRRSLAVAEAPVAREVRVQRKVELSAAKSSASRSLSSGVGLTNRNPANTPSGLGSLTQTTSACSVSGSESAAAMPSSVKSNVS